ncbi:MAG: sensor domain-containing diguanylate cyclase [Anaerolineales bacterium]|nr:MAG: sensor domain-containing diguanylate cyclase [Anaerolineales bacterium]
MIDHLRAALISRTDPEIRRYRARTAPTEIKVLYILLGAWLLVGIAFSQLIAIKMNFGLAVNLISILVLGLIAGFTYWLVKRGDIAFAGNLMASTLIVLTGIGILISPESLYIMSAGFPLAIMAVGAIVGSASVYPFAVLSFVVLTLCWFRAQSMVVDQGGSLDDVSGAIFLSTQAIAYLGLAAMLHTLSRRILKSINQLHSQTDQLTELALTDPLTSLANRRHLIDQLESEFTRARRYRRPLSLIYIDMDGFKSINDRFGHLFGDEILRGAALAMRAVLRSADLLARIGGDEFSVLLPETDVEGGRGVANKLRKALSAYSQRLDPVIPPLSFSAGVGQLRREDKSIDDLLARADEAQYRAKEAGKGQIRTQLEIDQLPLFEPRTPNTTK